MADNLTQKQRSYTMARIRSKNTKPEMLIRRGLHALGFRFRLHRKDLPGKPDLLLPQYKTAVFVHGCFWHGHNCSLFKHPATRTEYWLPKISGNRRRDQEALKELHRMGFKTLIIWECALRGPQQRPLKQILQACSKFIKYGRHTNLEIRQLATEDDA